MLTNLKRNDIFPYIILYFLLLFKAGYCFVERFNSVTAPLFFGIIVIVFLFKAQKISKKKFLLTFSLIILENITYIFTGFPDINIYIMNIISLITALILSETYDFKMFTNTYSNLILVICIASIFGWIAMEVAPAAVSKLPVLLNSQGREGYYALLTIISDFRFTGANRSQGIFWEPGAYQTFIVFAVLFDLFYNKKKPVWRYLVYMIAIILTFSTTGLINLFLLILLISNLNKKRFKLLNVLILCCLFMVIIIKSYDYLPNYLKFSLFKKIELLLDYQVGASNAASSRVDSIYYPLKAFLGSPIWGVGINGYQQMGFLAGHTMFTFTPINYFAKYGILYGILCMKGLLGIARAFNSKGIDYVLAILIIILSITSEDYAGNTVLYMLIMYGSVFTERRLSTDTFVHT